jgi:U6 snRNA-associated Sm-like protein LSm6
MEPKQTPADFLRLLMGRSVRVKLVSGEEYLGIMVALDETMNVVLEKAEEFVGGLLNKKYEEIFLRGNNGRQY